MVELGLLARGYTLFGSAPMLAHRPLPNIEGNHNITIHLPGAIEIFNGWMRKD